MKSVEEQIFQAGSTTYYVSSKFFPKAIRQDVFGLYSFVRTADNYVDAVPQQTKKFHNLRSLWDGQKKSTTDSLDVRVVGNMRHVQHAYAMDPLWTEAFLNAMEADLTKKAYKTLPDTLEYVYGSAEVIGLMMARIMDLPTEANEAARLQGRAMQWINFVRDIAEDNAFGRCYFPQVDLKQHGLADLSQQTAQDNPDGFRQFITMQLDRYDEWQAAAEKGFHYIPRRYRIPLQTAADMYNWTAQQIRQNPYVIYQTKVKPRKRQVMRRGLRNLATAKP